MVSFIDFRLVFKQSAILIKIFLLSSVFLLSIDSVPKLAEHLIRILSHLTINILGLSLFVYAKQMISVLGLSLFHDGKQMGFEFGILSMNFKNGVFKLA
jgi:hypothetical protein